MEQEEKSHQHSDIQNSSSFTKVNANDPQATDFNHIIHCTSNPSNSSSTSYVHDINGINSRDVFIPPENNEESYYSILQSLRVNNVDKIVLGHININSIRNIFDVLVDLIRGKIDILLIAETKIDNSFPTS